MCKSSSKSIAVFVIGAALGAIVGCYVISERKVSVKKEKKDKEKKG